MYCTYYILVCSLSFYIMMLLMNSHFFILMQINLSIHFFFIFIFCRFELFLFQGFKLLPNPESTGFPFGKVQIVNIYGFVRCMVSVATTTIALCGTSVRAGLGSMKMNGCGYALIRYEKNKQMA